MSARAPRAAALNFIFMTVALDMLALGLMAPVLPRLVLQFTGGDATRAAQVFGAFGTVWALMQFVFAPILGSLSDRFGRRPVILISNLGMGLDYIVMALAPSVAILFIGRVISGITASSMATASAYIADVTPAEKRAGAFGMIGAAFGLGFVVGPAVGGLLGIVDPRLPFWAAAGLSLANVAYGYFVLPESLPRDRRAPFSWLRANPIGSLNLLRSHPELLGLASVMFLAYLAHEVLPSVFVLYGDYRYGWDAWMVGVSLAIVGVCSSAVQMGLVRPVVAWLGERRSVLIGLVFFAASMAIFGAAPTGPIFWIGIVVLALGGFYSPSAQGLMALRAGPAEQGQLQGALGSMRGIAMLVGPILFTQTFARSIDPHIGWNLPGAPWFLASAIVAVALGLAAVVTRGGPDGRDLTVAPQLSPVGEVE